MSRKFRIAFATVFDPQDVNRGSGTYYHMARELERQGHSVIYVGPLTTNRPLLSRLLRSIHLRLGKRYKNYLDPFIAHQHGSEVSQHLRGIDYDLLLTNDYGIAGYCNLQKPIVIYTDAMLPKNYQAAYIPLESRIANLPRVTVKLFQRTIYQGLNKAAICVFPVQWIADEAVKYGTDPKKISIIPFGANIEDPGPEVAQAREINNLGDRSLNLLFVGKDWIRKGGDIAIQTIRELRDRGIEANLQVVGSTPSLSNKDFNITVHGLLSKDKPNERQLLDHLFRESDILILPSSSEGFVIVALEAAAYGIPTLAYDIEGVNQSVIDGFSGRLLPPQSPPKDFADIIEYLIKDPIYYKQLQDGARNHYEKSVNWTNSINEFLNLVKDL